MFPLLRKRFTSDPQEEDCTPIKRRSHGGTESAAILDPASSFIGERHAIASGLGGSGSPMGPAGATAAMHHGGVGPADAPEITGGITDGPIASVETYASLVEMDGESGQERCGDFHTPEGGDSGSAEISHRGVIEPPSAAPTDLAPGAPLNQDERNMDPHTERPTQ